MLSMSKSQHVIRKIEVTYVPVNSVGVVYFYFFISSIRPVKNFLVDLILANNESGALQPVAKVDARSRGFQLMFHTDG